MPGRAHSPARLLPSASSGVAGRGNEVGAGNLRRGGLRILRFALGILCAASACGNVNFVPAPFAPRNVELVYSQQEDITAVRWRMSAGQADPAVTYELADASGGWQSVDFAASLYPGGVAPCGQGGGICAQMVLPGHYQPPVDSTPVRSHNPTYGISPGDIGTEKIYPQTLVINSHFTRDNQTVAVSIRDEIGGDSTYVFPRPLQRAVWSRRGLCVPGFYPADTPFDPVGGLTEPWPPPAPLSDTGLYCAGVRTQPTSGATGTDDQTAIDTVPEVFDADMPTYTVPTEETPFTYQIVLDLSIPAAGRCQEAIQEIQTNISNVFSNVAGRAVQLRALPLIDLSTNIDPQTGMPGTPCRQSPYRALDAVSVGNDLKRAAAAWPEQHRRYYMLYFNNLRAELPTSLTQSFSDLAQNIATNPLPGDFQAMLWPWGPPEMTSSYTGWSMQPMSWSAADDPNFISQLTDFAQMNLPIISEIQDPTKPVQLLSNDDAQKYDGGLIRLCTISITPPGDGGLHMVGHDADGKVTVLPTASQYPVKAGDPPAFLLEVPPVWAVPDVGFAPHKAKIHYEICKRYCDHAFTAEAGNQVVSGWLDSPYCLGGAG
jgi:hypothetical protein